MTSIALIAAMYAALTLVFAPFSFGTVQVRVSEALTLLPVFSPIAIWGVTLGCAISNLAGIFLGSNILGILDVFFGTGATLLAAGLSYLLRKVRIFGLPVLAAIPPILLNGVIVGGELTYLIAGGFSWETFLVQAASVAVGEAVSCLGLGLVMVYALEKTGVSRQLFRESPLGQPGSKLSA